MIAKKTPKGSSALARMKALRDEIEQLAHEAEQEARAFVDTLQNVLKTVEAPGACRVTLDWDGEEKLTIHYIPAGARTAPQRKDGTRDPRLPEPGTKRTKIHKGTEHTLEFTEGNGVLLDGTEYGSVSSAAKHLTGNAVNGFAFFNLK